MNATGRTAIVTGRSSGIGLAIADMLAREGYALTLVARDAAKLADAAAQVRSRGVETVTVPVDLAHSDQYEAVVSQHLAHYGRIDVLVNNAGLGLHGEIAELSTRKLDLHIELNLRSAFLLMQQCIPALRAAGAEHGKALIVNVSSIFGKLPRAGVAAYSMTKAGLVALSQAHTENSVDQGSK
ncbi:SDR family NAD(P)-dependent oxidoreductase [Mycolicibacterium baixiangningiae]|uniref:SDR family NAD(P)-dependent oxidoreductase n=1 Tax=Mycolicibacterium baixiangningiae TaxID=2761578 RepID=UPI0027DA1B18|nr:SDR family oxidoreductase [Mycolicibacterium baixiangningiae]